MITIRQSVNADSRTAKEDSTIQDLEKDTRSHISDVEKGLNFMASQIQARGQFHDHTKLDMLDEFHRAFKSGHIKDSQWYHKHVTQERHHLLSYVHKDVTLVDVVEMLVDCVMAGCARSGNVYDIEIPSEVLQLAVKNTVELLKSNVRVVDQETDIMSSKIE